MTKQGRPATSLANLRPLCLQEPIGKAVAKLVSQKCVPDLKPMLPRFPQFAYSRRFSVLDALRQVSGQGQQVKAALDNNRSKVWTGANRPAKKKLMGGIQIFWVWTKPSIPFQGIGFCPGFLAQVCLGVWLQSCMRDTQTHAACINIWEHGILLK